MLNKLRNFSKGKLASVLVAIIIVPFVFWGMGSVFSGGNTNNVAKINNFSISTENFVDYINESKIKSEIIKNNIDENILEDLLSQLISTTLIDIEIEDQNIRFSDKNLAKRIRKNTSFQKADKSFSRIKYEKFLLENNITATEFESKLRNKELKKNFFSYISGGITSPYFFANNAYKNQTKEIEISYINLNSIYKKKGQFTNLEIEQFITNNEDKLKNELIDFSYTKITPKTFNEGTEFNENFFSKIDEMENLVFNDNDIKNIANKYSLKLNFINDYSNKSNEENEIFKEIFLNREKNKIQLIDKNDYYLLFQIENIKKVLPSIKDENFINLVKNTMYEKNKFDYNKNLLIKISDNKFTNTDFMNLNNDKNLIKKDIIKSIKEVSKFSSNSIKLLYSIKKNGFLLMDDNQNNIYLTKVENIFTTNLKENSDEFYTYSKEAAINIRSDIYGSYDSLMNEKYNIEINSNTLERVKNYFR